MTQAIIVGLQTSADQVYHLRRRAAGSYIYAPEKAPECVVELEDETMKPLVSGPEAKRYEEPETDVYILFPYERNDRGRMRLIPAGEMANRYPRAWNYLQSWEDKLRKRENRSFDDDEWYRFGRNQNIDKQDLPKLVVPRLVDHLRCALDSDGQYYLDNVDVGGVLSASSSDPAYLMGIMNGPVADVVFRAISKPFRGDYRSANRQFIAPLPVPNATPDERANVAARARSLQTRWTRRRDLLRASQERLSTLGRARHSARWLWPDLPTAAELVEQAPGALKLQRDRVDWAKKQLDNREAARLAELQGFLDGGGALTAGFEQGELRLFIRGGAVLQRIFLEEPEGRLAEAYWRFLLLSQEWNDAQKLAAELRGPPREADSPAARQFIERVRELAAETRAIAEEERAMDEVLFRLYGLTAEERALVENETSRRARLISA